MAAALVAMGIINVAAVHFGGVAEASMTLQQIFGLQVLLSFVLFTLVARWYVSPRLATLPVDRALQPLLVLHATRHMGLVFLVPTVVGGTLPAAFASRRGLRRSPGRRCSPWPRSRPCAPLRVWRCR